VSSVIVLGAGVVGLSTALYLQRAGRSVTVIDALPPAGGASFGNAGMISADNAAPVALPGMLRKIPGWLTDRDGPLVIRAAYLPRVAPWLARWVAAGRMDRALHNADAMRALHQHAFICWRELLGDSDFSDLIRRTGQLHVWEGQGGPSPMEETLRKRHGVRADRLGADELRQLCPELSRDITSGLLLPGNGHTVDPARLVRSLSEKLLSEGGMLRAERALKLLPRDGGGWTVMTNIANPSADAIVVACGAWSARLLAPLDLHVPLETERGYHVFLRGPSLAPRMPVTNKTRGFAVTPMEHGLRVAGTVEFAGLEAAPDERRATVLEGHAQRMFPGLHAGDRTIWMGFRPSLPDSLPVLGPAPGRPGLFLAFGHSHFGMTGGPPSGRVVARMMTGENPGLDPAPYAIQRFHNAAPARRTA